MTMNKTTILAGALACLLGSTAASAQQTAKRESPEMQAALQHGLRPSILKSGEPVPHWSLQERMTHHKVPGVAIAVLKDGEVVHAAGYGLREAGTHDAIDANTLFSVGSVSKVITAATTLRLVAQRKIDLDRNVNDYLTSWHIPAAPAIANPVVTMRMLMSHTSGLTVHGFEDYLPGEKLPTLVETLDGKPPAKNEPVRLQREPGLLVDYSGGGVMVEQQVIEDVTGTPLTVAARVHVFDPVGMRRSTFQNPLSAAHGNIAKAHDDTGKPTALPRGWQTFPEQAASGLWTSANDLGAFVAAVIKGYRGNGTLLPRALATQMVTEVSPGSFGLGPELSGAGATRRFVHNGDNDSYHAGFEGYLESGDGFVILTNGENSQQLRGEIRNALSDALGHGVKPLIRTTTLDLAAAEYADYAGTYRIDTGVPMDLRRGLADWFDLDTLEVKRADGAITVSVTEEDGPEASPLLPLTPARFIASRFGIELEFHRDAHGKVRALSVEAGNARAYYRRQASATKPVAADSPKPDSGAKP